MGKDKNKDKNIEFDENKNRRIKYCQSAPEWAEHARFNEDDEPCDDGRTGIICGNKKGEKRVKTFCFTSCVELI